MGGGLSIRPGRGASSVEVSLRGESSCGRLIGESVGLGKSGEPDSVSDSLAVQNRAQDPEGALAGLMREASDGMNDIVIASRPHPSNNAFLDMFGSAGLEPRRSGVRYLHTGGDPRPVLRQGWGLLTSGLQRLFYGLMNYFGDRGAGASLQEMFINQLALDELRRTYPRDVRDTVDPVGELVRSANEGNLVAVADRLYGYFVNIADVLRSMAIGVDFEQFDNVMIAHLREKAEAFKAFAAALNVPENARLKEALMAKENFADRFQKAETGLRLYNEHISQADEQAPFVDVGGGADMGQFIETGAVDYGARFKKHRADLGDRDAAELVDGIREAVGDLYGVPLRRANLLIKPKDVLIGILAELMVVKEAKARGDDVLLSAGLRQNLNKLFPMGVIINSDGTVKKPAIESMRNRLVEYLKRIGISGAESGRAFQDMTDRAIEQTWLSYEHEVTDSGRFTAISDGLRAAGYAVETASDSRGVSVYRLTEVDDALVDFRAISMGDKEALREGLKSVFKSNHNSYNINRVRAGSLFPKEEFERLSATLTVLGAYLSSGGKRPEDVTVCVAGHGMYDVYTILFLLRSGYRVVSRETGSVHGEMVIMYRAGAKERYGVDLVAAADSGQLVRSDYRVKGHPVEYDMVVWSHPSVRYEEKGHVGGLPKEALAENLKKGGVFVIQTDAPKLYIEPFAVSEDWQPMLTKRIFKGDTLLFSGIPSRKDDTGTPPSMVGIFVKQ